MAETDTKTDIDKTDTDSPPAPAAREPDYDDELAAEALDNLSEDERNALGLDAPVVPAVTDGEGEAPKTETVVDPVAPAGDAQTETKTAPDGGGTQPMIPKARFDEVNRALADERQRTAYLAGMAEARKGQPVGQPAGDQPRPDPTPEEQIAAIDAEGAELVKKFDNGDMTTGDYIARSNQLQSERTGAVLTKALASHQPTLPPPDESAGKAWLEEKTLELNSEYPLSAHLDPPELQTLVSIAQRLAAMEGERIDLSTFAGTYDLRRRVAALSVVYGAEMLRSRNVDVDTIIKTAGQKPSPDQKQPQLVPLTPAAKARAAKLDLEAQMPPDVGRLGSGADAEGLTAAAIEALALSNPAALEELSAGELAKYMT